MNGGRIAEGLLCCAAALVIGWLSPPLSDAQIVSPDQSIGPQSEGTAPLTEGVIVTPKDEPAAKGLKPGFERPLSAPDRMADGDEAHIRLRVPDQTEAEDVRDNDERAGMSF